MKGSSEDLGLHIAPCTCSTWNLHLLCMQRKSMQSCLSTPVPFEGRWTCQSWFQSLLKNTAYPQSLLTHSRQWESWAACCQAIVSELLAADVLLLPPFNGANGANGPYWCCALRSYSCRTRGSLLQLHSWKCYAVSFQICPCSTKPSVCYAPFILFHTLYRLNNHPILKSSHAHILVQVWAPEMYFNWHTEDIF